MAMLFSRRTWAKFSVFRKKGLFFAQNVFISDILVQIRNQRLKINPCAKFQQDWTKDKGARIWTWNDTGNCLMTSYLPHSDDVSNFLMTLRDFVIEYYHAKIGGNWTTNKGQTEGGQCAPSLYFTKIPQPE